MSRFQCHNCNYIFESRNKMWEGPCPYCGEKSVDLEQDTGSILDEV